MKRKQAIARAEKRAVRRWVKRYQSTYAGVMAAKDDQIERQAHEMEALRRDAEQAARNSHYWEQTTAASRERADQLDAENERLRAQVAKVEAGDCPRPLSCFRLQTAEFRASSLESDLARVTRERDQWKALFVNEHDHASTIVRKVMTMGDAVGCGPDATPDDILKAVMGMRAEAACEKSNAEALRAENGQLEERCKAYELHAAQLVEASGAPCPELLWDTVTKMRKALTASDAYANSLRRCDAQTLAYAENWRLVLAMPTDHRLDHECGEYRVDVYRGPREGDGWHKAPEEALRAAGVTVPDAQEEGEGAGQRHVEHDA